METYSSPISVASCWAAVIAASASRESCGAATVEPDAEGSRLPSCRQLGAHGGGVGADRGEQRRGDAVALGEQRAEQVRGADIGVAGQRGGLHRGRDGLLGLGGGVEASPSPRPPA